MQELTPHFSLDELRCKCGCATPEDVLTKLSMLALQLEKVRSLIGEPIHIISAHRCAEHNKSVGGAENSQHVLGTAVDLKVSGKNGAFLTGFFEALIASNAIEEGGLGSYTKFPNMIHYDVRGSRARWRK